MTLANGLSVPIDGVTEGIRKLKTSSSTSGISSLDVSPNSRNVSGEFQTECSPNQVNGAQYESLRRPKSSSSRSSCSPQPVNENVAQEYSDHSGHLQNGASSEFHGSTQESQGYTEEYQEGTTEDQGANYDHQYQEGANYEGQYQEGANYEGQYQEGANYEGQYQEGVNYDGQYQEGANYDGQYQEGANYDGQYQEGANYDGQYQEGANYDGQYQEGTNYDGQYQEGTNYEGQYQDGTNYEGQYQDGTNYDGQYQDGTNYDGQYQEGTNQDGQYQEGTNYDAPQHDWNASDGQFHDSSNGSQHRRSGSDKGSPKSCYKCNETGHFARDCTKGDTRTCYKCNQSGHISRDCPEGGNRSGCFKCNEDGHMARDCPNEDMRTRSFGGRNQRDNEDREEQRGRSSGSRACFKCNKEGHMARDCTEAPEDPAKPPKATYEPAEVQTDNLFENGIDAGTNFDAIRNSSVEVTGSRKNYQVMTNFGEAGLSEEIHQNIVKCRYSQPTKIQQHCIPMIADKRDIMACAQTGSGKTAAFIVPILDHVWKTGTEFAFPPHILSPTALVVTPTRELANQIYVESLKFSNGTWIKSFAMYGGISVSYERARSRCGFHVLIATPGRLLDNLSRGKLDFSKTEIVVLDEADRMLDMGFKDSISTIFGHPTMRENRQTLMFSATFPRSIQQLARSYLNDYLFVTVGMVGAANADVKQIVMEVSNNEKKEQLGDFVQKQLEDDAKSKILVFVESKRSADFMALFLSNLGIATSSIHGDRSQEQREAALRDFKCGRCNALVATSVASRGLDIKGVSQVVNFDMPKDIDEYVHRIGRTGRVGNRGLAVSFFDANRDGDIRGALKQILEDASQEVPEFLKDMEYGVGQSYTDSVGGYRKDARAPAKVEEEDDGW